MSIAIDDLTSRLRIDTSDLNRAHQESASLTGKLKDHFKELAGLAGIAFGTKAVVDFFKTGFDKLEEMSKVQAQTQAVLKSTGEAAGVSAEHVDTLAASMQELTHIDREQVTANENMLLTFTNVKNAAGEGNDIFDQATKLVGDLSVAMGIDGKDAAIKLGKSLNDPALGLTALTRVGVTFNDQQKEQIRSLEASGRTMDAQKVIIAELNKEFGGSAEAWGKSLPGQIAAVKQEFTDTAAKIVGALLPSLEKLGGLFGVVATRAGNIAQSAAPALGGALNFVADHIDLVAFAAEVMLARLAAVKAIELAAWAGGIAAQFFRLATSLGSGEAAAAQLLARLGQVSGLAPALEKLVGAFRGPAGVAAGAAEAGAASGAAASGGIATLAGGLALAGIAAVAFAADLGGTRTAVTDFLFGVGDDAKGLEKLTKQMSSTHEVGQNFLKGISALGPREMNQALQDSMGLLEKFTNRFTGDSDRMAQKWGDAWNRGSAQVQSVMGALADSKQFDELDKFVKSLPEHSNDALQALKAMAAGGDAVAQDMVKNITDAAQEAVASGDAYAKQVIDLQSQEAKLRDDPAIKDWADQSSEHYDQVINKIHELDTAQLINSASQRDRVVGAYQQSARDIAASMHLTSESISGHVNAAVEAAKREASANGLKGKSYTDFVRQKELDAQKEAKVMGLTDQSVQEFTDSYVSHYTQMFDKSHPEVRGAVDDLDAAAASVGLTRDQFDKLSQTDQDAIVSMFHVVGQSAGDQVGKTDSLTVSLIGLHGALENIANAPTLVDLKKKLTDLAATLPSPGALPVDASGNLPTGYDYGIKPHAEGGIITRPEMALLGDGNETEWVVPAHKAHGYESLLTALVGGRATAGVPMPASAPVATAAPVIHVYAQTNASAAQIGNELAWRMRVAS